MENSIARITTPDQGGTCYFLNNTTVATCYHVVGNVHESDAADKWESCEVIFDETYEDDEGTKHLRRHETRVKNLLNHDEKKDVAILELKNEMLTAEPVMLSTSSMIPTGADWKSFGYPVEYPKGIPLSGQVQALVKYDVNDEPRVVLQANHVKDSDLGGISGAPVFVDGEVVGHLTSNAINDEEKNIFGLVYAVDGKFVRDAAASCVEELNEDFGMAFIDGKVYVKRGIEKLISEYLLQGGVRLNGYLKSGKSNTINYFKKFEKRGIFSGIKPQDIKSAFVDFSRVEQEVEEYNLTSLVKFFCDSIVVGINTPEKSFTPPDLSNTTKFKANKLASDWFKKELLSYFRETGAKFFIYADNGERILRYFDWREACDPFFQMLKSWTDADSRGTFGILMSFTDALFLKELTRPAVFNFVDSRDLNDFNELEIQEFARYYCRRRKLGKEKLSDEQIKDIIRWIGGNPCMVRLLFDGIAEEKERNKQAFDFNVAFNKVIRNRKAFRLYLDELDNALQEEGATSGENLSDELSLYKSDYIPAPDHSKRGARQRLVKSGILLEQQQDDGDKSYKLRCGHFSL